MPTYDFECEPCAYYTEIVQSFNDPSTHKCPHCGKNTLKKIFINPPTISIRGEPTTIASLADRNTEKMGHYELQDKTHKDMNNEKQKKTREHRELNRKINNMSQKEKVKWIREGD